MPPLFEMKTTLTNSLRLVGASFLLSCATPSARAVAPEDCPLEVPANAATPDPDLLAGLVGDYDLVQRVWQPLPATWRGTLHLQRSASARVCNIVTTLVGWYESPTQSDVSKAISGSRDPDRPGAMLRGERLRIGANCAYDGSGTDFTITAIAPTGFWGYWVSDPGIAMTVDTLTGRVVPDAAGFFCAIRVPAGNPSSGGT